MPNVSASVADIYFCGTYQVRRRPTTQYDGHGRTYEGESTLRSPGGQVAAGPDTRRRSVDARNIADAKVLICKMSGRG